MTKEELEKEAYEYFKSICDDYNEELERTGKRHYWVGFDIENGYIAGAEPREKQIDELKAQIKVLEQNLEDTEICENGLKNRIAELEALIEKYRQAVDKCLHITFMGIGCEVNTMGQYATLVDGYLTDVEGLAKWKK